MAYNVGITKVGDLKRLPIHRLKTTIVSEITELAHAPNFGYIVL